jgi:hypothetical protein
MYPASVARSHRGPFTCRCGWGNVSPYLIVIDGVFARIRRRCAALNNNVTVFLSSSCFSAGVSGAFSSSVISIYLIQLIQPSMCSSRHGASRYCWAREELIAITTGDPWLWTNTQMVF